VWLRIRVSGVGGVWPPLLAEWLFGVVWRGLWLFGGFFCVLWCRVCYWIAAEWPLDCLRRRWVLFPGVSGVPFVGGRAGRIRMVDPHTLFFTSPYSSV
jgi:hypothetical protein